MRSIFMEITPVKEHLRLVRVQFHLEAAFRQLARAMNVYEAAQRVAIGGERRRRMTEAERFPERALPQVPAVKSLFGERAGSADPSAGARVTIVEDHQGAFVAAAVGVREHVLIHVAVLGEEIVEQEAPGFREQMATMQQG